IDGVWQLVEDTLQDGRPFLCGDAFTAADLTFASLAAPLTFPDEHPFSPRVDTLPAGIVAIRAELVARPAGQFALRMYREHRMTHLSANNTSANNTSANTSANTSPN